VTKPASLLIEPVRLGGMPIAWKFAEQLRLREALEKHVPSDPRDLLPVSSTLLIALINVILERFPLYKMGEWARERRLLELGRVPQRRSGGPGAGPPF